MLKWEIICSQEQGSIDAMSPLVEQLLRLHSHIRMLSTAGVGLTVSLYSLGLIIPDRGVSGYDDTD